MPAISRPVIFLYITHFLSKFKLLRARMLPLHLHAVLSTFSLYL